MTSIAAPARAAPRSWIDWAGCLTYVAFAAWMMSGIGALGVLFILPVLFVAATGTDVTDRRQLEDSLQEARETAAQQLADALTAASWRRLRRLVLSPAIVLRSQARKAGRDSWRRRVFREIIRRTGKPIVYSDSRARVPSQKV